MPPGLTLPSGLKKNVLKHVFKKHSNSQYTVYTVFESTAEKFKAACPGNLICIFSAIYWLVISKYMEKGFLKRLFTATAAKTFFILCALLPR